MDGSWFRRSFFKDTEKTKNPGLSDQRVQDDEDILGVTEQLINYVKSFTLETFKNFPSADDSGGKRGDDSSGSVRNDLSEWQERHAILILSKVKEIAHLRYKLCPRYLKERQFWKIYFSLVKSHVAE
ncbi:hypothetical protein L484_000305 [Morus notabilis]|nr:uncharacterized protein LOC21383946 [Morus notabilis]EXC47361.1 hypothetical protein L484_000305 [Morus notabilis]